MDETNHSLHPRGGHETVDVNVWAVYKFAIALVALCVIALLLLFGLMRFFQAREATMQAPTIDPVKVFPEPQLQKTPVQDLQAVRTEEEKMLSGYGWVDPQKGLVRMPIDQAIDVLAKRGLPSRAQAPAAASGNVTVPTESSLGPKMQREGGPLSGGGNAPLEATMPFPPAEERSVVGPTKGHPEQVNTREVQKK
jgi:hypothetical protein